MLLWWADRRDGLSLVPACGFLLWGGAAGLVGVRAAPAWAEGVCPSPVSMVICGEILVFLPMALGLLAVFLSPRLIEGPVDGWFASSMMALGAVGVASLAEASSAMLISTGVFRFLPIVILGSVLGSSRISSSTPRALGAVFSGILSLVVVFLSGLVILQRDISPVVAPLVGLLGLIVWIGLLVFLIHAESGVLSREIAEEVELKVLPSWSLDVFPFFGKRALTAWGPSRAERRVLNGMFFHLAMRKAALRRGKKELEGLEIVRLRERLSSVLSGVKPSV